jgi:hypothetical protein
MFNFDTDNHSNDPFMSQDRIVKLLSDSVNLMPENIKKETEFVELLVGVNNKNVESVFRQIDEDNFKKASEIINFAVEIRLLEVESFLKLVSLILYKFGAENITDFSYYFRSLLISRGILSPLSVKSNYDEEFTEFAADGIEKAIREDDVERFSAIISDPSFNAKDIATFSPVNNSTMNECQSYMQLIAFFGAVNCFRQAIMNDDFNLDLISKFAIAGGSNEIVRILEQKGVSFDNCFKFGVKHHRMDLCDWLLMHMECESISLSSSLEFFNYPAFFFTMINEYLLPKAIKRRSSIIEYADKRFYKRTPLHVASEYGKVEIVKYLIEQCHANVEEKDNYGWTPLHIASARGKIKVVKYLIEQCHANVEENDNDGKTPLHIASAYDKIEVVKYLIEQYHADLEAKANDG